jgi:HlyD family secretion protein
VAAGFETPTLFTIANDLTQMRVIADVDEADIGQVADGQRVTFTVDAYPDDVFEGVVEQVRLEATTSSSVVTYEVVITAHNPDLKLKPGLTANVTIYTLEKNDVLVIPTKALRYVPDEELLSSIGFSIEASTAENDGEYREVWVKDDHTLRARLVRTGTASGDKTEITEGLTDGETVVTGLTTIAEAVAESSTTERSPFMPSQPGSNKKK